MVLRIALYRSICYCSTSQNKERVIMSIRTKLIAAFCTLLALFAAVTFIANYQLSNIGYYNTRLDERAFRMSLASDWALQAKIALAKNTKAPDVTSELVSKLKGLTTALEEKRGLDNALSTAAGPLDSHVKALDDFNGALVGLQIADSKQLQEALDNAVKVLWSTLILGLVIGITVCRIE